MCDSILEHDGLLRADNTIKYQPEASVLKLGIGDTIELDQTQFVQLRDAFFAEIERKFT